ncbi:MAG: hypothetical protein J7K40_14925 [candidate division Zixibacteria bacterium]|nr:hypothetical protein [candidate division Zixibacteria bacterium]
MNRFTFFLLIFLLLIPVGISANDLSGLILSGDSLFESYKYEESIEYYDNAAALDSFSAEAYWKLARSLNLFAEFQPKDEQLELYEKASKAAEKTITIDSLLSEGHFEYARDIGKIALFKGIFSSIGLAKKVKKEAEITLKLNPEHDGAYHMLGRWHREVAKKSIIIRAPLGLGEADKKKGLALLAKAIELKPDLVHHRLEYGISLLDSGYKKEAYEQFEICLDLPAPGPLDIKYQKQAKEYLAKQK